MPNRILADQGNLAAVAAFTACRTPKLVKMLADEMESNKSAVLRARIIAGFVRVVRSVDPGFPFEKERGFNFCRNGDEVN